MQTFLSTTAILSPFIAAYLTHLFVLRSRKKEIDINKEKSLNVVLANLLSVRFYSLTLESVINVMKSPDELMIPKEYYPMLILNSGILKDESFGELDASIENLKEYDPMLYHQLEGIGNRHHEFQKRYVKPILEQPGLSPEIMAGMGAAFISQMIADINEYTLDVAHALGKKRFKEVQELVNHDVAVSPEQLTYTMNRNYYDNIMSMIPPDDVDAPTFEEFMQGMQSEEFQFFQSVQVKAIMEGGIQEITKILSEEPDISLEEIAKRMQDWEAEE
ncbi:MAG: hypothetical protein Crog4KO_19050 [Crocinitomicaceae bacterium]